MTDPLTGVGNLRMLTTTLAREVERARHFQRDVALLILDIDHFREINDIHGHAAGDAILAAVAARRRRQRPRGGPGGPLRRRGVRGRLSRAGPEPTPTPWR